MRVGSACLTLLTFVPTLALESDFKSNPPGQFFIVLPFRTEAGELRELLWEPLIARAPPELRPLKENYQAMGLVTGHCPCPWSLSLSLSLVPGPWSLVPGPWSLVPVLGPWSLVPGPGPRSLDPVPGPGPWSLVPGPGPWFLVLVPGPWS